MIRLLARIFIKDRKNYQDLKVREKYGILCGVTGIVCNIISSAGKIIVGIISGSIAVLSDGLNNLADMASSVIGIISAKLSNRRPDKEHPFGHGRYEYIASLTVAFLILFMALELMISSVQKVIKPEPVDFSIILIIAMGGSILIKLWMFGYNYIYAKKTQSMVLKATSFDSISDVITTSVILIATIVGQYTTFPLDALGGILVSALIAFGGLKIAKEAIKTLLGNPPSKETITKITKMVMSGKGIIGTHDLMVHDYGPGRSFASIHAEVSDKADIVQIHEVIDRIETEISQELGIIMVIHMDPISTSEDVVEHKQMVQNVITEISPSLKLHDFRMVGGVNQINLIFDLVVPYNWTAEQRRTISTQISEKLTALDSRYKCVIQVETEFV